MRKLNYLFAVIMCCGHVLATDGWDIIDKSMTSATPWDADGGAAHNKAWKSSQKGDGITITQKTDFVNITKTGAASKDNYAYLVPAGLTLEKNTAYSFEVKARVNPIDKTIYPDQEDRYECNQISARFHQKNMYIYLKYGDTESGYVSLTPAVSHQEDDLHRMNTSEWHVYRFSFHADNTKYDVYIDNNAEPIFKDVPVTSPDDGGMSTNIIRLGAETNNRGNLDIAYVRMGTGMVFNSPKIMSVHLSSNHHATGIETRVTAKVNTVLIEDGEKLLYSLVNEREQIIASTEITVNADAASGTLTIPAGTPVGDYIVKVSVPDGSLNGYSVAAATVPYTIVETLGDYWDIIDKSMATWDMDEGKEYNRAWTITKSGEFSTENVKVFDDYVNIFKTPVGGATNYAYLATKELTLAPNADFTLQVRARTQPIDKSLYPDTHEGYESNAIAARINNAEIEIHLKHGDASTGYVALTAAPEHSSDDKYQLDTEEWHDYWFVFYANNTFDVYIDDIEEPIFENVRAKAATGDNLIKIGAAKEQRCNLDIKTVKMKNGISAAKPKIIAIEADHDSYLADEAHNVEVTAQAILLPDGDRLAFTLTDMEGNALVPTCEAELLSGKATQVLKIPALPVGRYMIKVSATSGSAEDVVPKSMQYDLVGPSPIEEQFFPQVEPVGFVKDIDDYQYIGPSKEFITPCVLDVQGHLVEGKFRDGSVPYNRYYLFYSPHENPGGIYLMTAPTLDGPWTEQNTVIDLEWAKKQTESNVSTANHISACNVIWNDVYNKWFMYFHGPNTTTHYATSDNLVDWEFGASILNPQSFGSPGTEASYAKIYEHTIPDLGNKYVMIIMINEGGTRKVYWAHSKDGIEWTCIKKPLVSPDLNYKKIPGTDIKPNYRGGFGNNVAPALFMASHDRYFVFVGASSGNVYLVEVGEAFDMEIHWGELMNHEDFVIDTDEFGQKVAVPRISSISFIQDDNDVWYMFFEAGGRLGANTAYAKEGGKAVTPQITKDESRLLLVYPTILRMNESVHMQSYESEIVRVALFDMTGRCVRTLQPNAAICELKSPSSAGLYLLKIELENGMTKHVELVVSE